MIRRGRSGRPVIWRQRPRCAQCRVAARLAGVRVRSRLVVRLSIGSWAELLTSIVYLADLH